MFDFLKNKKDDSDKQLMEEVNKLQKMNPNHFIFKDVKNTDEYKFRGLSLKSSMNKDYIKAIEYCNMGLKINPSSPYLFYMRGRTMGDLSKFDDGVKDLDKAIELSPNFSDAISERGYIKQKIGDFDSALKDYKKAKEIEPLLLLPELNLKSRGVKFFFIINKDIPEDLMDNCRNMLITGLSDLFSRIDIEYDYYYKIEIEEKKDWKVIKILCNNAKFSIKTLYDIDSVYTDIYNQYVNIVEKTFLSIGIVCEVYYYGLNYQIHPKENGEFIPIPETFEKQQIKL